MTRKRHESVMSIVIMPRYILLEVIREYAVEQL
jgi:hypothetical protein